MRVLNIAIGVRPSALRSKLAVLAVGALWLGGCGRAHKDAGHVTPPNEGGSSGAEGEGAGQGGVENGATGGTAGGGGESHGGRAGGGASSGGRGGQPSGGASGAGTAGVSGSGVQAGAGGAPLPDLPLPVGCQGLNGFTTELFCGLDVTCDAVAQSMRCYHTSSGAWQCTCEPPSTHRTYLIDGATGLDACAVGAGLCAASPPEGGFDLDACSITRDEADVDQVPESEELQTCTIEMQCERPVPVDFAPGVRAVMPGGGTTVCVETLASGRNTQATRVDCESAGSFGTEAHAVIADSVADACRPVLELYLSANEPEFDGSTSCVGETDDLGSPGSCRLIEKCFDGAPLSNSVSVVKDPSERVVSCGFDDLDNLGCGCRFDSADGDEDTFNYSLGVAPRPAVCDLSDCTLDMRAEPAGAAACQAQEGSLEQEGENGCRGYFPCSQPATLAGADVTIYSQLNARCARGEDDAFYCGCAAGDETAVYRAGNLPASVDACAAARTECLAYLSLPMGPAASAPPPPDPLLGL
jgi:hypothetical protein